MLDLILDSVLDGKHFLTNTFVSRLMNDIPGGPVILIRTVTLIGTMITEPTFWLVEALTVSVEPSEHWILISQTILSTTPIGRQNPHNRSRTISCSLAPDPNSPRTRKVVHVTKSHAHPSAEQW